VNDAARYNRIVSEIQKRDIEIAVLSLRQAGGQSVKDMAADDMDYTKRLELTGRLDAAVKRYDELSRDPGVIRALAVINRESAATYRLGPTPKLKTELPALIKRRSELEALAIRLKVVGNTRAGFLSCLTARQRYRW